MKITTLFFFFGFLSHCCYAQQKIQWEFRTKAGVYSSPIINEDVLYIGSNDSIFYALDKSNGALKWKFKTRGQIRSKACIYHQTVLFNSTDGHLYCLEKDSGQLIWHFKTEGEKQYDIWDYYLSSPVLKSDSLFVGSGDHNLYCINVKNGELIWKYNTEGIIHATAVLDEEKVYIGSFDGHFYALNQKNGELIWKFKTIGDMSFPKGEIQKGALLYNNAVIFGSRDYNIYSINTKTGQGLWNMKEKGSWIIATPLIHDKHLYFGTSDSHKFYKMNADYGSVESELSLNMRVYASAISHHNDIIFPCFNGKVYKLSPNDELVTLFQTHDSKKNYFTIFNQDDHFVEGFQLYGENYKDVEKQILGLGSILSTPVIDTNILYFADATGYIYALKLKNETIEN